MPTVCIYFLSAGTLKFARQAPLDSVGGIKLETARYVPVPVRAHAPDRSARQVRLSCRPPCFCDLFYWTLPSTATAQVSVSGENVLIQMSAEINADGGLSLTPHILTGHTCAFIFFLFGTVSMARIRSLPFLSGALGFCLYIFQLWGHAGQIITRPDVINVFLSQQERSRVKDSERRAE